VREPVITVNGQPLTIGQAMAVRVAVTDFHGQMQDPDALGTDEHGWRMVEAYKTRLDEVLKLMLPNAVPGVVKRLLGGTHG
jgi:hypothetical protein